jgi:hypothetical protein
MMLATVAVWLLTYGVTALPQGSDPQDDLNRWVDSEYSTKADCETAAIQLREKLKDVPDDGFAVYCEQH